MSHYSPNTIWHHQQNNKFAATEFFSPPIICPPLSLHHPQRTPNVLGDWRILLCRRDVTELNAFASVINFHLGKIRVMRLLPKPFISFGRMNRVIIRSSQVFGLHSELSPGFLRAIQFSNHHSSLLKRFIRFCSNKFIAKVSIYCEFVQLGF